MCRNKEKLKVLSYLPITFFIGISSGGRFEKRTNFKIAITASVTTPPGVPVPLQGFVYRIQTNDGTSK